MIHLKSKVGDKSALLRAQEISCSTNVKVFHRYFESITKIRKFFKCLQSFSSLGSKARKRAGQQIAKSFFIATSHSTSHLMEVTESKHIGAVDDDGVGIWYVESRLYYISGDEDIVFMVDEVHHDFFKFFAVHLSMSSCYSSIWDEFHDQIGDAVDFSHSIVNKENLSTSSQLVRNGISDNFLTECLDFCRDWLPIGWRSGDHRKVACAHERKVKCSRNRRGGESQDIYIDTKIFELVFYFHSKFLLLVDDQQAKILEYDIFVHDFMRTDQDVYFPSLDLSDDFLDFFGGAKSVDVFYFDREIFQSLGECMKMLHGQNRRRHEDSHLLAVVDSFECCSNRYFCLPKTHISADQSVHRVGFFHIGFDIRCSESLVRCVLIEK